MLKTPQSLRLHLGLFGRTNVGKSSLLNLVTGQKAAITSPHPGTTTDAVVKSMELLPLGPVLFLDTAGIDDASFLAGSRLEATGKIFDRTDIAILVLEADTWTDYEKKIIDSCRKRDIPCLAVVNKIDLARPSEKFLEKLSAEAAKTLKVSSIDPEGKEKFLTEFKSSLIELCPSDFISPPPLLGDLLPAGGTCILIVPIDLEAPKGRIILPQVQAVRDLLDHDQAAIVIKESGYAGCLKNLKSHPGMVVCDSQVVDRMVRETPEEIPCTTFSILFARWKGDLTEAVRGVKTIDELKDGDRVLIAEACTHHPLEDDIGRIKMPRWLREYTGKKLTIDVVPGRAFPDRLTDYSLIIHCGACMISRRETLLRINRAREAGIPITNYGVCISYLHGVLERVIAPFSLSLSLPQK